MKSAQQLKNALLRLLASASADTAIDWRVDSAWLLAASSLESASVRLDEPVCSTLISFFEKSWRICTIDRLAPKAEACDRSVMLAVLSAVRTLPVRTLSVKSVPGVSGARPRPAGLKVTPAIVRVDLPVSSKIIFSELPSSRLMPLKDASCAVVVSCWMIWLYWADEGRTRGLRHRVGHRRNDRTASTATRGVGADIDRVERDGSGRSSGPGDHLTRAVIGRGEGQTVRAGDHGREVHSRNRQRLVELVQ